jgi:predicted nucleotidyltransferase
VPIWKKEHFEGGEIWIGSQTGKRFESGSVVAEPTASSDGAAGLDRLKMDGRERDAVREFVARVHDLVGKNLVGVRLFGSYARGDHRPDSDIDIAVVVEGPLSAVEDAIYDAAFDVNLAREVFISPRVVQRSVFEDPVWRNTGFIRSLEKDGVPL